LRSELLYTLSEFKAGQMFRLLQKLNILRCIHPDLRLPDDLANTFGRHWQRSQIWINLLNRLNNKTHLSIQSPIHLGVELLISYLPHQISTQLDLGLTPEQKTRQIKLADLLINLQNLASKSYKISEITQNLQRFDIQTLILAGSKCEPTQRRILWHYLMKWQMIKSPLTGTDLKQLGYVTGKQMGEILQRLQWAMLDGEITNKDDAIAYLSSQK